MKNNSIKTVVATKVVLHCLLSSEHWLIFQHQFQIQIFNCNTQWLLYLLLFMVQLLDSFLALSDMLLKDALQYGSPWWTWVLVSGLIGLAIGLVAKKIKIEKGQLTEKDLVWFNSAQILANVIGWGIIAPYGDILIYSEPASKSLLLKVFYQLLLIA